MFRCFPSGFAFDALAVSWRSSQVVWSYFGVFGLCTAAAMLLWAVVYGIVVTGSSGSGASSRRRSGSGGGGGGSRVVLAGDDKAHAAMISCPRGCKSEPSPEW